MRNLLILLMLSSFGCAGSPRFPKLTHEYFITVTNGIVYCHRNRVISTEPYEITPEGLVPIQECNGISGVKVEDKVDILVWKDRMLKWGKEHCK